MDVKNFGRINAYMRIIDAHIHFCQEPYFDEIAELAGHQNTGPHLKEQFASHNIAHGVVMGNAPQRLKDALPRHPQALTNDEDGVAEYLLSLHP